MRSVGPGDQPDHEVTGCSEWEHLVHSSWSLGDTIHWRGKLKAVGARSMKNHLLGLAGVELQIVGLSPVRNVLKFIWYGEWVVTELIEELPNMSHLLTFRKYYLYVMHASQMRRWHKTPVLCQNLNNAGIYPSFVDIIPPNWVQWTRSSKKSSTQLCTSSSISKSAHLAARVEWRTVSNALEKWSANTCTYG